MIIFPAIDIRQGRVVRLREGDPEQETVFDDDPLKTADRWVGEGAQWLHVVNLDGAFSEAHQIADLVGGLVASGAHIQFGGGLRSAHDIDAALALGVSRVVIGTAAVQNPGIVADALARHGQDAICVALDARDGIVATHGWRESAGVSAVELGKTMARLELRHCLFTDVAQDGTLAGVNLRATVALAEATGLAVIASGGVNSLDDIRALASSGQVAGAVIGMALYQKRIELRAALAAAGVKRADETNHPLP